MSDMKNEKITHFYGSDVEWPSNIKIEYDDQGLPANREKMRGIPYVVDALVCLQNKAKEDYIDVSEFVADNGIVYAKIDPEDPNVFHVGTYNYEQR